MAVRFRPIHSSFETLRHAGNAVHAVYGRHHFGHATNEQLSARGYDRAVRPAALFADFRAR